MTRTTRNVSVLLAAIIAVLGFAGLAHAGEPDTDVHSKAVSYSDLDLGRPADAAELYTRIGNAASEVCRSDLAAYAAAHAPIERLGIMRRCRAQAIDTAVVSVSNANLTALHTRHADRRALIASSR
jgi:UrcA family protein